MAIEFNGKLGNVNNTQVSGKKSVDTEGKKGLAAQKNVFEEAKVDNKYQGEKTDLLDASAYYNSLGINFSSFYLRRFIFLRSFYYLIRWINCFIPWQAKNIKKVG